MEELDLLKKAWKNDLHSFEQISELEIYKMIHKKSSSIVKWILIISIVEVVFWSSFSFIFNTDDYIKQLHAEVTIIYFKIFNVINFIVIIWFIYSFYKNYIKISTITTTKKLMQDILKTRKTVQYYVWYNLSIITLSIILGFIMGYIFNPKMEVLKDKIAHEQNYHTIIITFGFMLLILVVIVGLFWLFYKLLYGILLKRLYRNYKELEKIDL